jgi:NADH-quinone oxidoreductase subunit N
MPANFLPSGVEFFRFLPEIILTVIGTLVMVLDPLMPGRPLPSRVALGGLFGALWAAIAAYATPGPAFQNMLIVDGFATFFRVLVIGVGILAWFTTVGYLRRERADENEFFALLLFSVAGQCIMATANELMMVFIGLEISSISSYIMAGYLRDDRRNNESALKYFLLGSFATAFLLYGVAWIYGLTGSTFLTEIRRIITTREIQPSLTLVGTAAALMFVGFAFKVSAAPFQMWAPDVYQGAPAPVAAFMSAGPKAAAFAVFLRVYMVAFGPISQSWQPLVWAAALLSMIVGNFAALTQNNLKRLLAYSSIAHAGYVLVAVTASNDTGVSAAMFYMAAYALMNIGAFAVVTHVALRGERHLDIDDMAGLAERQPATAALLTIFLASLIGIPLTAGFFAKFYVFKAALDANLVWLTVLGLLNSAVAAYYYLRILVVMYMHSPRTTVDELPALSGSVRLALWACAAGTLILGVFPSLALDFAGRSSQLVR